MNQSNHIRRIYCEPYPGNEALVGDLFEIIEKRFSDLFHSVIVHGSVATDEVISYSDFDGLLIVKDKYKDSSALRSFKRATMKRIYEFDPIQHHGWFEICEDQLKTYPQTYFPHELFEYSKTIYPSDGSEFNIQLQPTYNYAAPLLKLCDSMLKKIDSQRPKNIYALKGLLSQFMLLPALYCQARDQKGIFKKFSFESAKVDFSEEEWAIMDRVSAIRLNWHYDINPLQKKCLSVQNRRLRKVSIPLFAPSIPSDIEEQLEDNFFRKMRELTLAFRSKI